MLCLLRGAEAQESGRGRRGGGGSEPREIGAWLQIAEDGTITAFTGKAEVEAVRESRPTFEEVFATLVERHRAEHPPADDDEDAASNGDGDTGRAAA